MTQVFFYHNAASRIVAAAALLGKACRQGKAVLVYAPDEALAEALDRQLWVAPPAGFIPHVFAKSPLAAETPIVITADTAVTEQNERLLNLSEEVPPAFSRFASVNEVVGRQEDERQSARARVKFYKDRGYEVNFYNLSERH